MPNCGCDSNGIWDCLLTLINDLARMGTLKFHVTESWHEVVREPLRYLHALASSSSKQTVSPRISGSPDHPQPPAKKKTSFTLLIMVGFSPYNSEDWFSNKQLPPLQSTNTSKEHLIKVAAEG